MDTSDRRTDDSDRSDEPDEDAVSGMPDGEPELTPMAPEDSDEEDDDTPDRGDEAMPGIPTEGEPDVSG